MLTEVCQESTQNVKIKAQRCVTLPDHCADQMKEMLYSLDVASNISTSTTKPETTHKRADLPLKPGVSISGTTGEFSPTLLNDDMRPLKPFGLDVRQIKASGVIGVTNTLRIPPPTPPDDEPFAAEESLRDFGLEPETTTTALEEPTTTIKEPADYWSENEDIIDELLHTSTTSFIQSKQDAAVEIDKNFIDQFFEQASL
jgi:hypothetical protein